MLRSGSGEAMLAPMTSLRCAVFGPAHDSPSRDMPPAFGVSRSVTGLLVATPRLPPSPSRLSQPRLPAPAPPLPPLPADPLAGRPGTAPRASDHSIGTGRIPDREAG